MRAFLLQSTTDSQECAQKLAKALLKRELAACVKLSSAKSFFSWEQKECEQEEWVLNILTSEDRLDEIYELFKSEHNYEVFELVASELKVLNPSYEAWLKQSL